MNEEDGVTDQDGTKPKRFIAGAVCPRCGVMDRIVVSGDGEQRSCVDCDSQMDAQRIRPNRSQPG